MEPFYRTEDEIKHYKITSCYLQICSCYAGLSLSQNKQQLRFMRQRQHSFLLAKEFLNRFSCSTEYPLGTIHISLTSLLTERARSVSVSAWAEMLYLRLSALFYRSHFITVSQEILWADLMPMFIFVGSIFWKYYKSHMGLRIMCMKQI